MGTNPNNLVGTNGAYGGRTSVNAFNDVLSAFTTAGVVSGWNCAPQSGMTIQLGGDSLSRDVAIAEDPFGNRTTINNREGEPVPVAISAASATTQRIDCVVAYVNSPATVQSTTLDNPEAVGIIDVQGSSSSEPDDEAIRAAITADGGTGSTAYYVILATITVPAGATSITAGEIAQGAATMTEILANSVKSDNIDWATIDTGWVDIPYKEGFKVGSLGSKMQCRRIGNIVFTRGTFQSNDKTISKSTVLRVGTLPVGFRPEYTHYSFQIVGQTSAQVRMGCPPDGLIFFESNSDTSTTWNRTYYTAATSFTVG